MSTENPPVLNTKIWAIPSMLINTGTLATSIEVQNKTDALLPNKRILYIFLNPHRYNGIAMYKNDHRLLSITVAQQTDSD